MDKRNTIRLIIWGVLFVIILGSGILGFSVSKAKQRANSYYDNYNNYNSEEENSNES